MSDEKQDQYLTVKELAERWKCSEKTAYKKAPEIPNGLRLGDRSIRISTTGLEEYEAQHPISKPPKTSK